MTKMLIRNRLIELLIILGIIAIYFLLALFRGGDPFFFVKLYSVATLFTIYSFIRLQDKVVIFSPINLFCFYYLSVVLVNFYFLSTDFDTTPYLEKSTLRTNYILLFNWSTFYYLSGLVSTLIGYSVVKLRPFQQMKFQSIQKMDPLAIKIVAYCLILIGLSNFFYNVLVYASGNPFTYLAQIAARKDQFEDSGTTFGYIFYYMGSFLLFFDHLRKGGKVNWRLIVVVFIGTLLWISKGRIFLTLFYILTFVGINYFYDLTTLGKSNNRRYLFFLIFVPVIAVTLFTLRLISSLQESGALDQSSLIAAAGDVLDSFGFYLIDKGNLPNTALFLKVIDAWERDHGFLYGQSLFSWLFNILPSSIRPENYQPSAIIKNLWYSYVPTGNLPPTGVAEMYMNFGFMGPLFGMFVLGVLIKLFYNWAIKIGDFWAYTVMVWISLSFVMIYAKGEFDNLNLIYFVILYGPYILSVIVTLVLKTTLIKSN